MFLDRVRSLLARRDDLAEPVTPAEVAPEKADRALPAEPGLPPPAELLSEPGAGTEKKLSALDSVLVKLGMKTADECQVVEAEENVMEKIKCAGRAGIISYIIWEWIFWLTAIPVASFAYYQTTGSWPDLSDGEDQAKVLRARRSLNIRVTFRQDVIACTVYMSSGPRFCTAVEEQAGLSCRGSDVVVQVGASIFAFVNVARFAVPLRVGLALYTTPWVDDNIVKRFLKEEEEEGSSSAK